MYLAPPPASRVSRKATACNRVARGAMQKAIASRTIRHTAVVRKDLDFRASTVTCQDTVVPSSSGKSRRKPELPFNEHIRPALTHASLLLPLDAAIRSQTPTAVLHKTATTPAHQYGGCGTVEPLLNNHHRRARLADHRMQRLAQLLPLTWRLTPLTVLRARERLVLLCEPRVQQHL